MVQIGAEELQGDRELWLQASWLWVRSLRKVRMDWSNYSDFIDFGGPKM